ncbi:carbamoyltransferase C-terminal domain-containing protein [Synechococcus sp. BO 8801]|uniref:carbamoyltransferase C-terminal domain-containing protein n=1 Tax=Synechococcus sp. BO 8801 TaxID=169670 RepID=UPI001302EA57|nr:carbamoyltransferase C-terminal domain-containing protein [Synechococcus sp. BO 8801]
MSIHDRSACLVKDNCILSAISEERLDRRKHSWSGGCGRGNDGTLPPFAAINYVLKASNLKLSDVDMFVVGRSTGTCRDDFLRAYSVDESLVYEPSVPYHHLSHALSLVATSPFESAAGLVLDEQGSKLDHGVEGCSFYEMSKGQCNPIFSGITTTERLTGGQFFDLCATLLCLSEGGLPSGGKLMALAGSLTPYASIDSCRYLELDESETSFGFTVDSVSAWLQEIGVSPIIPSLVRPNTCMGLLSSFNKCVLNSQVSASLACGAQRALEHFVMRCAEILRSMTSSDNLCYSGGLALNCVANSRLSELGFKDVFIHPAAGDDGCAVGLAFMGCRVLENGTVNKLTNRDGQREFNVFLGSNYDSSCIHQVIEDYGLSEFRSTVCYEYVGSRLCTGDVIGWFEGGSEWGPRALGARSIFANPLIDGVRDDLNWRVKHREPYRPYGVLGFLKDLKDYIDVSSCPKSLLPYMLSVGYAKDDRLSKIAHVDGSIRLQSVEKHSMRGISQLLAALSKLDLPAILINTSYNFFGEPIVETPCDAIRLFIVSKLDALVINDSYIEKRNIDPQLFDRISTVAWRRSPKDPRIVALNLAETGRTEAALDILRLSEQFEWYSQPLSIDPSLDRILLRVYLSSSDEEQSEAIEYLLRHADFPARLQSALSHWIKQNAYHDLCDPCTVVLNAKRLLLSLIK